MNCAGLEPFCMILFIQYCRTQRQLILKCRIYLENQTQSCNNPLTIICHFNPTPEPRQKILLWQCITHRSNLIHFKLSNNELAQLPNSPCARIQACFHKPTTQQPDHTGAGNIPVIPDWFSFIAFVHLPQRIDTRNVVWTGKPVFKETWKDWLCRQIWPVLDDHHGRTGLLRPVHGRVWQDNEQPVKMALNARPQRTITK